MGGGTCVHRVELLFEILDLLAARQKNKPQVTLHQKGDDFRTLQYVQCMYIYTM